MAGGGYGRSSWWQRFLSVVSVVQHVGKWPLIAGIGLAGIVLLGALTTLPTIELYLSPSATVRQFLEKYNDGRTDQAIDYLCPGPVAALPYLGQDFLYNYALNTVSNNGGDAEVEVMGQIKLHREGVGTAKIFPHLDLTLHRDNGKWCIDGTSIVTGLVKWIKTDIQTLIASLEDIISASQ